MRTHVLTSGLLLGSLVLLAGLAAPPRTESIGRRIAEAITGDTEPATKAETFQIDPGHSMALFRVVHFGAGPFWGRFNTVEGTVSFAENSEDGPMFDVRIPIASIDTGMENLDAHLQSPDFFAGEEYEGMTFKSTGAKKVGDRMYEVTGDLTILGVTKPVTAKCEWIGISEMRGRRCGFETTFEVMRSDYGMNYGVEAGALSDATRIIVAIESMIPQRDEERGAGRGEDDTTDATTLPEALAQFDTDGDGKLSKDEAPERMQQFFERLDANGDGFLDPSEVGRRGRRGGGGGGNTGGGG